MAKKSITVEKEDGTLTSIRLSEIIDIASREGTQYVDMSYGGRIVLSPEENIVGIYELWEEARRNEY
jgi:hypothetical protein|tara:strand:- start:236 stop:436 length:201 start_codon:yes stop_codon:yes gene_type:complete